MREISHLLAEAMAEDDIDSTILDIAVEEWEASQAFTHYHEYGVTTDKPLIKGTIIRSSDVTMHRMGIGDEPEYFVDFDVALLDRSEEFAQTTFKAVYMLGAGDRAIKIDLSGITHSFRYDASNRYVTFSVENFPINLTGKRILELVFERA